MVNRCIMFAPFSKQFLKKKMGHSVLSRRPRYKQWIAELLRMRRTCVHDTKNFIERTVANCTLFSSDIPLQEFIVRTVAKVLCSPVIFIQNFVSLSLHLRGRLIRLYLGGDVTLDPQQNKTPIRIHSQTAKRAVGTGFREMTVSDFRQTIDLIALNARNQTRKLEQ